MSANTNSLRDRIKSTIDWQDEVVEVPEWGCTILVRSMTAKERYDVLTEAKALDEEMDMSVMYPRVIIATACDPDTGDRLFTSEDMSWIMDKNPNALDRLAMAGLRVSGMDKEALEEGKEG